MTQQLSHSTDNTVTSMYFFTHHYTLYLSKFLLLLRTPSLDSPLLMRMSQPHLVQGLLHIQYRCQSTYTAQTLLLLYTGYRLLILKATTQDRPSSSQASTFHRLWHIQTDHLLLQYLKAFVPSSAGLYHYSSYPGNAAACSGANTSIHKQTAPPRP